MQEEIQRRGGRRRVCLSIVELFSTGGRRTAPVYHSTSLSVALPAPLYRRICSFLLPSFPSPIRCYWLPACAVSPGCDRIELQRGVLIFGGARRSLLRDLRTLTHPEYRETVHVRRRGSPCKGCGWALSLVLIPSFRLSSAGREPSCGRSLSSLRPPPRGVSVHEPLAAHHLPG